MASPLRKQQAGVDVRVELALALPSCWSQATGYRAEVKSAGSWTCSIARCWLPAWVQRAPQLEQKTSGYRPNMMVMGADRHRGQRGSGMRTSLVISLVWVGASRTSGGCSVGRCWRLDG